MKFLYTISLIFLFLNVGFCQIENIIRIPTSIDFNGTSAHQSAVLDIKSSSKGILIPRMTTLYRNAIPSPDTGLLVYDTSTNGFWYFDGLNWKEIALGPTGPIGPIGPIGLTGPVGPSGDAGSNVNDADDDTSIEAELNTDDDIIRFNVDGTEIYRMQNNTNGINRISVDNNGRNILIGRNAGYNISTGLNNVVLGDIAGSYNVAGHHNVLMGYRSGGFLTSSFNTCLGSQAGAKITTGHSNTFLGNASGSHMAVGDFNVFLGNVTAGGITDGSRNTYVGANSAYTNSTGNNNVFIGYSSGKNLTSTSNRLIIENSASNYPLIYGEFDSNKVGINWDLSVSVPNTLSVDGDASKSSAGDWLANSDKRLKKNINYLNSEIMLSKLLAMKGVSYEWNDNSTGYTRPEGVQFGFIAQDLEEVWPNNVEEDNLGYLQTPYGTYDYLYVESIKALHKENEVLKSELEVLKNQTKEISNHLNTLLTRLNADL